MNSLKKQRAFLLTSSILLLLLLRGGALYPQVADSILYKRAGSTELYLHIDYPPAYCADSSYPAIIFFFGGGWNGGDAGHFQPQAAHFAGRGMLCFRADYRVRSRQGSTPFESLKDARSAIRFIRAHAAKLGVDPDSIVAAGGSAGGHLAAACALVSGFDEPGEDLSLSCRPNALLLFNPVIDNGPGGYGFERIGEHYREFSPLHNLHGGAPPTLFLLGTEDKLVPVETARYYQKVMERLGLRCELHLYEGAGHGFFNPPNPEYFDSTLQKADDFLVSLGYLRK